MTPEQLQFQEDSGPAEILHFTEDGFDPLCNAPLNGPQRLAWFWRSVTCPDCIALAERR
ncbi:MAG TPA: hypothetical protein VGH66_02845 [Acidimicrobiales bacterium]